MKAITRVLFVRSMDKVILPAEHARYADMSQRECNLTDSQFSYGVHILHFPNKVHFNLYTFSWLSIFITDECYQLYQLQTSGEDFIQPGHIGHGAYRYKEGIVSGLQASKNTGI